MMPPRPRDDWLVAARTLCSRAITSLAKECRALTGRYICTLAGSFAAALTGVNRSGLLA